MSNAVEIKSIGEFAEAATWVADLSDTAILQFSGADAAEFMQGQFCNDLKVVEQQALEGHLGITRVQLSGYCSPKGRLLALFTVYRSDRGAEAVYRLVVHSSIAVTLQKRLSMFVLRKEVKVEKLDASTGTFGICCEVLPKGITDYLDADSSTLENPPLNAVWSGRGVSALSLPMGNARHWLLVVDPEHSEKVWSFLSSEFAVRSWEQWEEASVRAGLPMVTEATSDKFIPQMLNLQAVDGLSFKKGCYPGQEIVARMQYLGKLKRRMFLLSLDGNSCPPIGTTVVSADDRDAGTLLRTAQTSAGDVLALAVLKIDHRPDALRIEGLPATRVEVIDLPYEIVEYQAGQS